MACFDTFHRQAFLISKLLRNSGVRWGMRDFSIFSLVKQKPLTGMGAKYFGNSFKMPPIVYFSFCFGINLVYCKNKSGQDYGTSGKN